MEVQNRGHAPYHAGQLRRWGSLGNQRAGLVTSFLWNSEGVGVWRSEVVPFVKHYISPQNFLENFFWYYVMTELANNWSMVRSDYSYTCCDLGRKIIRFICFIDFNKVSSDFGRKQETQQIKF